MIKVAKLRDELRSGTYDRATVPALQQIRLHVRREEERALAERDDLRERSQQYESLGAPFERIAREYRAVRDQVKEKKWALTQIREG